MTAEKVEQCQLAQEEAFDGEEYWVVQCVTEGFSFLKQKLVI